MNYLLDTHTFLWFINDDRALSPVARDLIEHPANTVYLSIASLWKIAIKVSLGKLDVTSPFPTFMLAQVQINKIKITAIKTEYVGVVATLPFHHSDPFDRLIITQAITEKIPVIGRDAVFDRYGVERYW